ncbi:MAG: hypothetical protein ACRC3H_26360 [Lachnospiraceae bacterium]
MKLVKVPVVTVLVTLLLSSCIFTEFSGSRTGNESQLIMEYSVLNKTDSQMLELQEDDSVEFTVISESGELDIILQKEEEDPIYEGTNIPTGDFQVGIEEAGTYKVSVTGKNAKGSVSIIRME